jgi:hypothetical protein
MNAKKLATIKKLLTKSVRAALAGAHELHEAKQPDSDGGVKVTRAEIQAIGEAVFKQALAEALAEVADGR